MDHKLKPKTIIFLEESLRKSLGPNPCWKVLRLGTKNMIYKRNNYKWNVIKLLKLKKNIYSAKEPVMGMKRQVIDWKNIYKPRIFRKGSHHIEYVKNIQNWKLNTINPIRNWATDMKKYFTEEYIWIANQYNIWYSTSLAIWEMQIKTTMKYSYIIIKKAKIKKWQYQKLTSL